MNTEILKKAGIDYDQGVRRFLNRADVFERMLLSFSDDSGFANAGVLLADKNYDGFFECIHGIKGISANLSMHEVFALSDEIVSLLRAERYDEIDVPFEKLEITCLRISNAILTATEG